MDVGDRCRFFGRATGLVGLGLAILLCSGCWTSRLTVGQIDPAPVKNIKRIAVLDFKGGGASGAESGASIAGIVQTRLSSLGDFEVIERERIRDLLDEIKRSKGDELDQSTVERFYKLYGVQGIIAGSIIQYTQETRAEYVFPLGNVAYTQTSVAFNLRLVDTTNAKVIYVASGENSLKNKTYLEVAREIVDWSLGPLQEPNAYPPQVGKQLDRPPAEIIRDWKASQKK
jgi:curli biogenesis system outer membrane secretion channel CsgG